MKYWTLLITYLGKDQDGKEVQLKEKLQDIDSVEIGVKRRDIFVIGFNNQTAETTWEWIAPYRILEVFCVLQQSKFAP